MSAKVKILAFGGSLRKNSYNKKVAKIAAIGAANSGAEIIDLDLSEFPLPIYNQEIEDASGLPDNAISIKKMMIESDGFIISSPEYNSSISAVLKNTIDWASRRVGDEAPLIAFKDKTALLVAASPGALGGLRGLVHIRDILGNLGMHVLADQYAVSKAHEMFDTQGEMIDQTTKDKLISLGSKFAGFTAKLKT
ncbi:MAG: NAD(P)H-dependent oxidoreductase [Bdellovibrionota bacterium]